MLLQSGSLACSLVEALDPEDYETRSDRDIEEDQERQQAEAASAAAALDKLQVQGQPCHSHVAGVVRCAICSAGTAPDIATGR
eukprot:Skav233141  [mRNA]  locus=scaffold792:283796:288956:+ [translate_table: standard]